MPHCHHHDSSSFRGPDSGTSLPLPSLPLTSGRTQYICTYGSVVHGIAVPCPHPIHLHRLIWLSGVVHCCYRVLPTCTRRAAPQVIQNMMRSMSSSRHLTPLLTREVVA